MEKQTNVGPCGKFHKHDSNITNFSVRMVLQVPVDLVIDHSVQVDVARSENAVQANMELEFQRNRERFAFLKWGSNAFQNMLVVPPGSGIVHQVCVLCDLIIVIQLSFYCYHSY